jgi:hypothetical protein
MPRRTSRRGIAAHKTMRMIGAVGAHAKFARSAFLSPSAGYNVYGLVDASGELEVTIRENAVARKKDHGSRPSTCVNCDLYFGA